MIRNHDIRMRLERFDLRRVEIAGTDQTRNKDQIWFLHEGSSTTACGVMCTFGSTRSRPGHRPLTSRVRDATRCATTLRRLPAFDQTKGTMQPMPSAEVVLSDFKRTELDDRLRLSAALTWPDGPRKYISMSMVRPTI